MFRLFEKLDLGLPKLPFWMLATALILLSAAPLPFMLIARSWNMLSDQPRIVVFVDMGKQARYGAQDPSQLFEDGRAMRPPVQGTVAWGERADRPDADALREDEHMYRGYRLVQDEQSDQWRPEYFASLPTAITVDRGLLERGRQQYMVSCYPCHGVDGQGMGPITSRGLRLQAINSEETVWAQAANLHTADDEQNLIFGPERYADGQMFHVIGFGRGNMPGLREQISVLDRWAIVAYVRAMQLSQNAPAEALPADLREQLRP